MDAHFPPSTVGAAIRAATEALGGARLDAHILVRHVARLSESEIITRPERPLSDGERAELGHLLDRRRRGEPIAYLIGHREFWSLDLCVTSATLIPRPETELLVERVLLRLPPDKPCTVLDLGTGTGAIALAIATERPQARIVATDRSPAALAVAAANAARLGIANVEFMLGDWFGSLTQHRFDVIASNPPYLRADDPHLQVGDVRFEPHEALVGGGDGLDAMRQISATARAHLQPHGWLLLEHGFDQVAAVQKLLGDGGYVSIVSYRDLAGHDRVTEARAS